MQLAGRQRSRQPSYFANHTPRTHDPSVFHGDSQKPQVSVSLVSSPTLSASAALQRTVTSAEPQTQTQMQPPQTTRAILRAAMVPPPTFTAFPPAYTTSSRDHVRGQGQGKSSFSSSSVTTGTTARECAVFSPSKSTFAHEHPERPISDTSTAIISRRHSWSSFQCGLPNSSTADLSLTTDLDLGAGSALRMLGSLSSSPHPRIDNEFRPPMRLRKMGAMQPETETRLPRPGATLDMAYFLRNTGPPASASMGDLREKSATEGKGVAGRMRLTNGLFKRRKMGADQSASWVPPSVIWKGLLTNQCL
jgi:hypothetical protein